MGTGAPLLVTVIGILDQPSSDGEDVAWAEIYSQGQLLTDVLEIPADSVALLEIRLDGTRFTSAQAVSANLMLQPENDPCNSELQVTE